MPPRTWKVTLLSALVILTVLTGTHGEQADPATAPGNVIEQFDITLDDIPLAVPVVFNGKRHLFAVDTGANGTVVDTSLRPLLGEPIEVSHLATAGTDIQVSIFKCPSATVGNLRLDEGVQLVAQLDLKGLREVSGRDYYGIVEWHVDKR
jgi:Aspartyl protease